MDIQELVFVQSLCLYLIDAIKENDSVLSSESLDLTRIIIFQFYAHTYFILLFLVPILAENNGETDIMVDFEVSCCCHGN